MTRRCCNWTLQHYTGKKSSSKPVRPFGTCGFPNRGRVYAVGYGTGVNKKVSVIFACCEPPHLFVIHILQSLVDFSRNDGALLPASDLGSGDIVSVGLQAPSGQAPLTGVVFRINETRVTVSFEEYPDEIEEPTTLVRLGNEVTFRRYREALETLGKSEDSCRLRNILFGHTMPTFNDHPPPYTPMDPQLNSSQLDAVQFALAANDVALIHGPPGTGKTTAVIDIILVFVVVRYAVFGN